MTDTPAPQTPAAEAPVSDTSATEQAVRSALFVCNQNAVRSPMAEALARRYSKQRLFVESAGLIAGALDPFSVSVLGEEGIDISGHKALTLGDVDLKAFDLVVALTEQANEKLEKLASQEGFTLEYWATPDPTEAEGNRNQIIDSYRLVRDHLECRIADRFHF